MGLADGRYVEDILKRLSRNFYRQLVFAGIIDDTAKLLHFQKGEAGFPLTISRQNAIDVQISFLSSLAKQFQDFAGKLDFVIMSFGKNDIIVIEVLPKMFLYVICTKGSAPDMADMLTKLVEENPYLEDEWSG